MKKILSFLLAIIIVTSIASPIAFAAEESEIHIFYKDQEIAFEKNTVLKNDTIMCQMIPLFEAFEMEYNYNALKEDITASFENVMLKAKIGADTLEVNDITVELDETIYLDGREVMFPLDTFCYIYNIQIDKTDLSNVKLWIKEKEVYDLEGKLAEFNKVAEPYKTTIYNGGMEYADTATRQKPDYFHDDVIDVEGQLFDKALDLEVTKLDTTYYGPGLVGWNKASVKKGDILVLSFWAKGVFSRADAGKMLLNPVLEQNKTWKKSIGEEISLSNEWKEYRIVKTSIVDMDDWSLNFRFHHNFQEFYLADVKLDIYSGIPEDIEVPVAPPTYEGMEDDALWRKEALKRIEKYRKNDMVINVVDKDGNPVEGAKVNAKMTRSEFNWGSMIWSNEVWGGRYAQNATGLARQDRLETFKDMGINTLVADIKLSNFKGAAGNFASLVNWAIDNDIDVRAHCLYWEAMVGTANRGAMNFPDYQKANWNIDSITTDEFRRRIDKELNMALTYIGNHVTEIDVMNEVATRFEDGMKTMGWDEGIRMYEITKALAPNAKTVHLETVAGNNPGMNALPDHLAYTKYLKDMGAPIDIGGLQGHCSTLEHPHNWYICIDQMAQITDEVAITEFDNATGVTELKGQYFRDTLIACYSHPALSTFVVWTYNYVEKSPTLGVFFGKNDVPNQEYYEWQKLVNGEWKTNEDAVTDAEGKAKIRGHRGRYDITVSVDGKKQTLAFTLGKDDTQNVINVVVDENEITMDSPNKYIPKEKLPYVNSKDFGKMTDINLPEINREWTPTTIIKESRDIDGKLIPHIFDGKEDSFWSAKNSNDYIKIELGENVSLQKLVVHWHSGNVKRYNRIIEISEDGEEWKQVVSGRNAVMDETIDLSKHSAKYIRISGTDGLIAIDDVQVYIN